MATAKSKGAGDVLHAAGPDGSHSIGVTIDGYYIAFVTLDAARTAQLVENAADRAGDLTDDDDGEDTG